MQFRSVKRSNFSGGARAVARNMDQIFEANRASSTDFTMLAKESIKGRSQERRAAMEAEAAVARAGMQAYAKTKATSDAGKAAEEIAAIKRPAQRMAGVVGALGALSTAAVMNKNNKEAKAERLLERQEQAKVNAAHTKLLKEERDATQQMIEDLKATFKNTSSTPPVPPKPGGDSSDSTPTPSTPAPSTPAPSTPASPPSSGGNKSDSSPNPRMRYMQTLTSQGMTPVQAAATVGHLVVETGNFRHMEELEDNSYGTRGYGHLQWTDPSPGTGRRTDFMNWSKQQGLDPTSFEANSGFLNHEMTTNFNKSWTGGGNFKGFQQTGSMEDASNYLRTNYIRPSAGSEQLRIDEGYAVLDEWNQMNR